MDLVEKYKAEVSEIEELVQDLDKACVWTENALQKAGDVLGYIESLRPKRLLGVRAPRIQVGPFECVQRCISASSSADTIQVVCVQNKPKSVVEYSVPYYPLNEAFKCLYLITHATENSGVDENEHKQETSNKTIFRLLSYNPEQQMITLADSNTLKKSSVEPDLRIPEIAPPAFYEGQVLSQIGTSLEIGSHLEGFTLNDLRLPRFQGVCRFIVTCLPHNATLTNVEDVLVALDECCKNISEQYSVICLANCSPFLCNWGHLQKEWKARHKSSLQFLGVPQRDHAWDLDYFSKRALVARFNAPDLPSEDRQLPFLFTSLPLVQHAGWRPVSQTVNLLDVAVQDIVKNRHLMPALWMSSNPASVHPNEVDSLKIDPRRDTIFVCPNEQKYETHLGRHGLYCGIFVPPLTVAKVDYYGVEEGKRSAPPWKQLSVELASFKMTTQA